MVEMTVDRVGLCTQDGTPVVVLRERNGERLLPVKVSTPHANAVIRHHHRLPPFRPQTHEVFIAVVRALGAKLSGAYIEGVGEDGFTASFTVLRDGRAIRFSASAADALVLAVRGDAPIFVAGAVLERHARSKSHEPGDSAPLPPAGEAAPAPEPGGDAFRQFIDTLSGLDDLCR